MILIIMIHVVAKTFVLDLTPQNSRAERRSKILQQVRNIIITLCIEKHDKFQDNRQPTLDLKDNSETQSNNFVIITRIKNQTKEHKQLRLALELCFLFVFVILLCVCGFF